MKKIIVLILFFLFCGNIVSAKEPDGALTEAYLRYNTVGWQTYEFYVLSNLNNTSDLDVEWTVDEKESYSAQKLHYFFKSGDHTIKVRVEDKFGNVRYDKIKLSVYFWSLQDNWFWWILYLFLVLMILYYWAAKIVYVINRRKVSREARYFLDALDEHGWLEQAIEKKFGVPAPKKYKAHKVIRARAS